MKALIIDDEQSNITLLANMLEKHCPQIEVIGHAASANEGYLEIQKHQPDLVFLDVKMPGKSGFDLLRMFNKITFSVIFVTGFDEFAVKAFEFNAVDYILKPIDHVKLASAVKKAELKQKSSLGNVIHFVHSIEEKTNYVKRLTIHSNDKVHVLDLNDIVYIEASRGYSEIVDTKNQCHISAKYLSEYEELLEPLSQFIRVNKSFIINSTHVASYSKGNECIITMKPCNTEIEVSRRKKTEVLSALKG
jgi:two-component system LytT family response regulator